MNKKYNSEGEKREARLKSRKRYRKNNKEKVSNQFKNWRLKNKEYLSKYFKNYNLNEQNNILGLIRRSTWNKYGSAKICSICGSIIKVEHHHLLPYSVDNFIDLCKICHKKAHMGGDND